MIKPTRKEADSAAIWLAVHCEAILPEHQIQGRRAVDTLIFAYQDIRDRYDVLLETQSKK